MVSNKQYTILFSLPLSGRGFSEVFVFVNFIFVTFSFDQPQLYGDIVCLLFHGSFTFVSSRLHNEKKSC